MIAITFLLVSGLYNLIAFERESRNWGAEWHNGPSRLYHVLLGVKLLLALAIFFLASAGGAQPGPGEVSSGCAVLGERESDAGDSARVRRGPNANDAHRPAALG